MEYFLVLFYIILFSVFIWKSKWFQTPAISKKWLVFAFIAKVVAGFLYAYIHQKNGWGDVAIFFQGGEYIGNLWPEYPKQFFRLIAALEPHQLSPEIQKLVGTERIPYYGRSHSGFVVRMHGLLHIFSFGYFHVHCVFFSFFSFIGIFTICSFFEKNIQFNPFYLYFFAFFAVSILFWSSGAHKDALILLGLGLLLTSYQKITNERKWMFSLLAIFALFLSFEVRSYTTLLFVPALFTYWISGYSRSPLLVFSAMYSAGLITFFLAPNLSSQLDFPAIFIDFQGRFSQLGGNSNYSMPILEPTAWSFALSTPYALFNTFLRPWITENHSPLVFMAMIENLFILVGIVICFTFKNTKRLHTDHWRAIYLCLFFALSFYWLIGLVVTNTGAIVRYRITGLIFLGIALISIVDSNKINHFFAQKLNIKLFKS